MKSLLGILSLVICVWSSSVLAMDEDVSIRSNISSSSLYSALQACEESPSSLLAAPLPISVEKVSEKLLRSSSMNSRRFASASASNRPPAKNFRGVEAADSRPSSQEVRRQKKEAALDSNEKREQIVVPIKASFPRLHFVKPVFIDTPSPPKPPEIRPFSNVAAASKMLAAGFRVKQLSGNEGPVEAEDAPN